MRGLFCGDSAVLITTYNLLSNKVVSIGRNSMGICSYVPDPLPGAGNSNCFPQLVKFIAMFASRGLKHRLSASPSLHSSSSKQAPPPKIASTRVPHLRVCSQGIGKLNIAANLLPLWAGQCLGGDPTCCLSAPGGWVSSLESYARRQVGYD